MGNSRINPFLNPVMWVAELSALLAKNTSEIVVFDASVPPVVPGYESLNSQGAATPEAQEEATPQEEATHHSQWNRRSLR